MATTTKLYQIYSFSAYDRSEEQAIPGLYTSQAAAAAACQRAHDADTRLQPRYYYCEVSAEGKPAGAQDPA